MQKLFGSYDYVPVDGTPVVMLGFDSDAQRIVPVGVGRVNQRQVSSEGQLQIRYLDYIGYALVNPEFYAALESYARGEIMIAQLMAELGAQ